MGTRLVPTMIEPMQPQELERLLSHFDLSNILAAKFLGMARNTLADYLSGKTPVDQRSALLLRLMLDRGIKPEQVIERYGAPSLVHKTPISKSPKIK